MKCVMTPALTFLMLGVGTARAMHSRATATVLLGRSPTGNLPLSGLLPLRVAESLITRILPCTLD